MRQEQKEGAVRTQVETQELIGLPAAELSSGWRYLERVFPASLVSCGRGRSSGITGGHGCVCTFGVGGL